MSDKKVILALVLSTIAILFAGIVLLSNTSETTSVSASQNAKAMTLEPTSTDFGRIPLNGGNIERKFTIKNTGKDTLKLYNVRTSCHCTEANITINGVTSQNFGMSGVSSWIGEVPSGQEAVVTVIFDPDYHGPQGAGPVTRFTSVETNDRSMPKITFTLTGTVLK